MELKYIVLIAIVMVVYVMLFLPFYEKFDASPPPPPLTGEGSLWANAPKCKHAPTGYVFRSEVFLNNQNDNTNRSCIVNDSMHGLITDAKKCSIAPDLSDVQWKNPLSFDNCSGDETCTKAVDLSEGKVASPTATSWWNSPSCVVTFNQNVTHGQLQAFEDSLLEGVTGFLSANVVRDYTEKINLIEDKYKTVLNEYNRLETRNSDLDAENTSLRDSLKKCNSRLEVTKDRASPTLLSPPSTPVAAIYENCDYDGWKVDLKTGRYNLQTLRDMGFVNDRASSLKFYKNGKVTLFKNDNFEGRKITFTSDAKCFKQYKFNDMASSIIVE